MVTTSARPRAILSSVNVLHIMAAKGKASAVVLGRRYGVTEKAIRDIWRGRTWAKETNNNENFTNALAKFDKYRARSFGASDVLSSGPPSFCSPISKKTSACDVDAILAEWDQGRTTLPCVYDPYFGFEH
eukprot:CAMPEP_0113688592 /NCGR_PEP_ID=MMETSP0038_2-20120614/16629_1 /TAXON_ID=2898 /ORGANISM="Cryptomonas paramecium" /LENGTH=129 /DNA_ID=CAMNT_0000609439 /DNA_START=57 /DNA_END=446 /DNA_ORIENTATION=+ /assembly_acc=CAM_ASM_000170